MNVLKILIVEENVETEQILEEGLRLVCANEGCSADFTTIQDGSQALEIHKAACFDLIIVDLCASGMEVIKTIRKLDTVVSFIVITAQPSLQTAIEAIELKVFAYMAKPFTLSELATQAQNAVAHSLVKKKLLNLTTASKNVLKRDIRG